MMASRIACCALIIFLSGCSSQADNDALIAAYFSYAKNLPVKGIALEPTVSEEYIPSLEKIAPVVERTSVETATHVLIDDHVVVLKIERENNLATVQAKFGPHMRFANLDCGSTVTIHLTRSHGRWETNEIEAMVC